VTGGVGGSRRLFRFPFFHRRQVEQEIDEELRFHLELRAEELVREGMSLEEARREARRRFGDVEYTRRYCRDQSTRREKRSWRRELLFDLGRDLRYALRHLRRTAGHSAVAIGVLALGIGASVTMFSVVNGVLLRPLPFPESHRLVRIWDTGPRFDGRTVNVNPLNFLDWRVAARSFEDMGAFFNPDVTLNLHGEAQLVPAAYITSGLLPTLRLRPLLGRNFTAAEDGEGGAPVVLLGYGFWTSQMGSDPRVVGRSLTIQGVTHEIIGVLGPEAQLPVATSVERPSIWLPSGIGPENGRGGHWLRAVGRLRPGVEIEGAQQELSAIAASLEGEYPSSNKGVGVMLQPLRDSLVGDARAALTLLAAAVGLLLLLACGNVANMLLARSVGRRGEAGVRTALGASRSRLVRQSVAESLCIAAGGGLIGAGLAALAVRVLKTFGAAGIPRLDAVALDANVLVFAVAITLVTGVLVGLIPGLFGLGPSAQGALTSGGPRTTGPGRAALRMESGLAVFQIALATILVTAAGLLFHSLLQLRAVDPGFETGSVVAIRVILPRPTYTEGSERTALLAELLERTRGLPGIVHAGASDSPPLQREQRSRSSFQPEDRPEPPPDDRPSAWEQYVTPGYLDAVGIPLLSGRGIEAGDDAEAPGVIVINDVLAGTMWPDEEAVGKRIRYNGSREVIGVVGSALRVGPQAEPEPEMLIPYAQWPYAEAMFITLRSRIDTEGTVAQFRGLLRDLDPGVPIGTVTTMRKLLSDSLVTPRLRATLLGSFALTALALAVVGIYAVLSYVVTRRRREFGLRIAVGADHNDIIKLVLRRGMVLAATGVALGVACSVILARTLRAFLFGVGPTDPATFLAVPALFLLVAGLACWLPARRATHTDPRLSLRAE